MRRRCLPTSRPVRATLAAITIGAVLLTAPSSTAGPHAASQGRDEAVATTPHFAFFSDLAVNLNDALVEAGRARDAGAAELFATGREAACFEALAPSLRAGWNRAVDYYAEIISPASWNARQQFLLRLDLAGVEGAIDDDRARQFVELAGAFRAAATPAYVACRWENRNAENRRWIEALGALLAAHEATIAARLEQLYAKPWDGMPIRVDVVETVNEQGANSIFLDPVGGHILVAESFTGTAALEVVFHEASHLLMGRDDPVQRALGTAAVGLDVPVPDDLWHVVLFYTTGETVRRVLEEAGTTEYEPLLYEIFGRSSWSRFRDPLETTWPPYLDGERSLSQAATDLMVAVSGRRAIGGTPSRRPPEPD